MDNREYSKMISRRAFLSSLITTTSIVVHEEPIFALNTSLYKASLQTHVARIHTRVPHASTLAFALVDWSHEPVIFSLNLLSDTILFVRRPIHSEPLRRLNSVLLSRINEQVRISTKGGSIKKGRSDLAEHLQSLTSITWEWNASCASKGVTVAVDLKYLLKQHNAVSARAWLTTVTKARLDTAQWWEEFAKRSLESWLSGFSSLIALVIRMQWDKDGASLLTQARHLEKSLSENLPLQIMAGWYACLLDLDSRESDDILPLKDFLAHYKASGDWRVVEVAKDMIASIKYRQRVLDGWFWSPIRRPQHWNTFISTLH